MCSTHTLCRVGALLMFIGGTSADRISDITDYINEVFSIHVPQAIEEAGLEPLKLPDITQKFQLRSLDGSIRNGKVKYKTGKLSGFKNGYKKSCESPFWSSGNTSIVCSIAFPPVNATYDASVQLSQSNVQESRLECAVLNIEVIIEITNSPHLGIPAVKTFDVVHDGSIDVGFTNGKNKLNDLLIVHFNHKFLEVLKNMFYGPYRQVVESGIKSISFPKTV